MSAERIAARRLLRWHVAHNPTVAACAAVVLDELDEALAGPRWARLREAEVAAAELRVELAAAIAQLERLREPAPPPARARAIPAPPPGLDGELRRVGEAFGFAPSILRGRGQSASELQARAAAALVLAEGGRPLAEVGRVLGKRTAAAAAHLCARARVLEATSARFAERISRARPGRLLIDILHD